LNAPAQAFPDSSKTTEGSKVMSQFRKSAAIFAATVAMAAVCVTAASAATTRSTSTCTTRTTAVTGWSVYRVCLIASDSFDGLHVSGYVSGVSCTVFLPTGAGWGCGAHTKGSYWNSAKSAWEDWLNFRLVYTNIAGGTMLSCVYLRVDTKPSGSTAYQSSTTVGLPIGASC
jgi:heme A synthase